MELSIKTLGKRVLEAVLVLGLVLLAFLVILLILNEVFPTGQSLFELVRPGRDYAGAKGEDAGTRDLRLSSGDEELPLGQGGRATAVLSRMTNSVKSKRAAQIAWRSAAEGMPLYDRDAVQTLQKSMARLTFEGDHFVEMEENSLIIVRKLEKDVFLHENRTVIVLMNGKITGEIAVDQPEVFNLEVVAPGAVARVRSVQEQERPARFRMVVQADESSILSVLEGTADLVIADDTLEVGRNQVVKVRPGRPPVYISAPPGAPTLLSPADGHVFSFREIPPVVPFEWSDVDTATGYRFTLAEDGTFDEILYEETVSEARFSHGNLKPGVYYWRVGSRDTDQQGGISDIRSFELSQDLDAPRLDVHYPESLVKSDHYELTGTTEIQARVFISGVPVRTGGRGEFRHTITLKRGPNVVVVEAVDKVGNVAYLSKIINAEY